MSVLSNDLVRDTLLSIRDRFNGAAPLPELRLYVNDVPLRSGLSTISFVEASWPGYTPLALTGTWGDASKAEDGLWRCQTEQIGWLPPGSGDGQEVFGAFYTLGGAWAAAERFAAPVLMAVGGQSLLVAGLLALRSGHLCASIVEEV